MSAIRAVEVALAFLGVATGGCATTSDMLAERFAKEQGCGIGTVDVTERSSQEYVAEGCGKRVEYVCESFAGMNAETPRCVERGSQRLGHARSEEDRFRSRPDLKPP
jgi:hypothetical protein